MKIPPLLIVLEDRDILGLVFNQTSSWSICLPAAPHPPARRSAVTQEGLLGFTQYMRLPSEGHQYKYFPCSLILPGLKGAQQTCTPPEWLQNVDKHIIKRNPPLFSLYAAIGNYQQKLTINIWFIFNWKKLYCQHSPIYGVILPYEFKSHRALPDLHCQARGEKRKNHTETIAQKDTLGTGTGEAAWGSGF